MVLQKLDKRLDMVKIQNNKLKKQNQLLTLYGTNRTMVGSHLTTLPRGGHELEINATVLSDPGGNLLRGSMEDALV